MRVGLLAAGLLLGASCTANSSLNSANESVSVFETVSSDGVRIFGYPYADAVQADADTILLFHQGGSSARGEYEQIAAWLNGLGYRAIAWDLRKGGEIFGVPNRTVANLDDGAEAKFCAAYSDVEAALLYAVNDLGLDNVVILGSSYSGSLVYQLAARHPEKVKAVLAFSPASGGPVARCRADLWAEQNRAPTMVLRPASEMEREPSQIQRDILVSNGASFFVSDPGTHGASMLLDERTGGDASKTREAVAKWLSEISQP